ncbi:MAG: metallophosphoesterase [Planctomycetaceae bacterium]|jgi:3',5'-cyclic AMP phosphodiesterase CpdA|nr:metallophosphoesterase [Planctomycetaceae bacterium]
MPISLPPIDRRRFLHGTLSGVATSLFPSLLWADASTSSQDVWAILSDTHIPGNRNRNGGKPSINPVEHFRKIRADILSSEAGKPVGLIHCGDCAYMQGMPEDYTTFLEEFEPIRQVGLPVHFLMGNHDNREAFLRAVARMEKRESPQTIPNRLHSILETPKANFFLLDSLENTNSTPGLLGQAQLEWLADELDARKDKPALLFAHHYPRFFRTRPARLTEFKDTDELLQCIVPRKQVKAFVFGHSHLWNTYHLEELLWINIPTTAWRDDPTQPFAWVLLTLKENGVSLKLRSIDPEHPKHNETVELTWR